MNILSFDIEEWALAKSGGYGTSEKYAEYDRYLEKILNAMDERGCKGTFFCTGMMATDFPQVVRLIYSRGHEVGCHSYRHTWMNKMSVLEAKEDTHAAIDALEQCIGQKISSYRAPAFSINENNLWMFEIFAENGITRDSSVYPSSRDFGGFPTFEVESPCFINYNGVYIKEFPICMTSLIGKKMAYSGGGYFRFFPLHLVRRWMNEGEYSICYFHINDLLPEMGRVPSRQYYESYFKEKGALFNRYKRYIKANLGKRSAFDKLMSLITSEDFVSLEQADNQLIIWDSSPRVEFRSK